MIPTIEGTSALQPTQQEQRSPLRIVTPQEQNQPIDFQARAAEIRAKREAQAAAPPAQTTEGVAATIDQPSQTNQEGAALEQNADVARVQAELDILLQGRSYEEFEVMAMTMPGGQKLAQQAQQLRDQLIALQPSEIVAPPPETAATPVETADTVVDPVAELAGIADTFDAEATQAKLDAILQGKSFEEFEVMAVTLKGGQELLDQAIELKAQLEKHEQEKARGNELLNDMLADAGASGQVEAVRAEDGTFTYRDKNTKEEQPENKINFLIMAAALAWDLSRGGRSLDTLSNMGVKVLLLNMGASKELISLFDTGNSSKLYQEMFNEMTQESLDKKIEAWSSDEITKFLTNIDTYDRKKLLAGQDIDAWPKKKQLSSENLKKLYNKLTATQRTELEFTEPTIQQAVPAT